jgi:hypothetical protein
MAALVSAKEQLCILLHDPTHVDKLFCQMIPPEFF